MTTYERGDIVETSDPFTDEKPSRPFLIVNTDAHPFHGDQYVAVTLTTKSWYDETVPLHADDFIEGGVPEKSAIVPWGVVSSGHDDVVDWFGRVEEGPVDRAVERLVEYLTA